MRPGNRTARHEEYQEDRTFELSEWGLLDDKRGDPQAAALGIIRSVSPSSL